MCIRDRIGTDPNGININEKCGATDVKALQEKVLETKADVGLAYDGDGDRIMTVSYTHLVEFEIIEVNYI